MQAQDDIVKAILSSLPTSGSGDQEGLPSFEHAIFQAENFIRAPLNGFLSNNWEQFASANYFDDSGLFLATVYSLPLIINSMLALVLVLRATCTMLVSVKRKQLETQVKAKKSAKKND
ncbi:unnamed protein product [Umbelopsis ramanniana]